MKDVMAANSIDMDKVRDVLRRSVRPAGQHSQRGLAREAGLDRDAVYDIIQGRNRNPSLNVLASLASAMGGDLSMFGVEIPSGHFSAAELERAILESLPAMPRRGSWERKASFLAEAVARILELPPAAPATPPVADRPRRRGRARAAPPRAATS